MGLQEYSNRFILLNKFTENFISFLDSKNKLTNSLFKNGLFHKETLKMLRNFYLNLNEIYDYIFLFAEEEKSKRTNKSAKESLDEKVKLFKQEKEVIRKVLIYLNKKRDPFKHVLASNEVENKKVYNLLLITLDKISEIIASLNTEIGLLGNVKKVGGVKKKEEEDEEIKRVPIIKMRTS